MKRVLCLLVDGFEEIEAVTPIDLLRRAGVEVVVAGVDGLEAKGRSGLKIVADVFLDEVLRYEFDALFLPGGPGVSALRKDARVMDLVRKFSEEGKWIAAICAAPLVLLDAGILEGKSFTAHFSTGDELPQSSGGRVEVDGKLVTSRGAGTALEFGLALAELLAGKEKADEVAAAVMA